MYTQALTGAWQFRHAGGVQPDGGLDIDWLPAQVPGGVHTDLMAAGRIYHHTPEVGGPDPQGWGVLELASADRARGLCGLFQLAAPTAPEYTVRLRGLDVARRYRVTWGNSGQACEVDGFTLMQRGLTVRLEGALTSELLLFEAI